MEYTVPILYSLNEFLMLFERKLSISERFEEISRLRNKAKITTKLVVEDALKKKPKDLPKKKLKDLPKKNSPKTKLKSISDRLGKTVAERLGKKMEERLGKKVEERLGPKSAGISKKARKAK